MKVFVGSNSIIIPQKSDKYITKFKKMYDVDTKCFILDDTDLHDAAYIKILDHASTFFTIDSLLYGIKIGLEHFDNLYISSRIKDRISKWVKSLGKHSYTWTELLSKPDYSLELFKKRFWPYIRTECKEWQATAAGASTVGEYPGQSNNAVVTSSSKDYKVEYDISQKYNNFLGYSVLDTAKYPNLKEIISRLKVISKIGLSTLMFEAVLRLLITPSSCHIIKYSELWELVVLKDKNYKDIFMHFMYYSMFILCHEDTIMFSQIKRDYRIIYTHVEALNMPTTYMMHIEQDPYIQQLTNSSLLQSVTYYARCERSINSIDVFERRLFLATGGALTNIPLHKYKAAISGSIIIPCFTYFKVEDEFKRVRYNTQRSINKDNNILFNDDLYTPVGDSCKLNSNDKNFMSYLEYYYPSYHSYNDLEYSNKVLTRGATSVQIKDARLNVGEHKELIDEKSVDVKLADKEIKSKYNTLSDIDISISVDNYDTFEEIANILIKQIKKNCSHIGEVWMQKIITMSSFKFKLYGPGLIRPIDLFRVSCSPEKMVKKFHLPIVRSWYDGSNNIVPDKFKHSEKINAFWKEKSYELINNSYADKEQDIDDKKFEPYIGLNILNSCLSAALSGINNNYKWFFNSKPCVEVVLKYIQRTISLIITDNEFTALIEYMNKSDRWKGYVSDIKDNIIHARGVVSLSHQIFNPCMLENGIRYKLRKFNKPVKYIYSQRMHVGMIVPKTEYGVSLKVKNNSTVVMPDVGKINAFIEYANQADDEYSDAEGF
jgi:hypothetical protein